MGFSDFSGLRKEDLFLRFLVDGGEGYFYINYSDYLGGVGCRSVGFWGEVGL